MTTPSSLPLDLAFLRSRSAQIRVGVVTMAFALVGLLYATFATKMYRSTMTVVAASTQKPGMASLLGSQIGGLVSAFDSVGGADAARIAAVVQT
jgi:uncharacterized protein involved in exopolysaccharide biosynthesis